MPAFPKPAFPYPYPVETEIKALGAHKRTRTIALRTWRTLNPEP
jgi:hypothetical protein